MKPSIQISQSPLQKRVKNSLSSIHYAIYNTINCLLTSHNNGLFLWIPTSPPGLCIAPGTNDLTRFNMYSSDIYSSRPSLYAGASTPASWPSAASRKPLVRDAYSRPTCLSGSRRGTTPSLSTIIHRQRCFKKQAYRHRQYSRKQETHNFTSMSTIGLIICQPHKSIVDDLNAWGSSFA